MTYQNLRITGCARHGIAQLPTAALPAQCKAISVFNTTESRLQGVLQHPNLSQEVRKFDQKHNFNFRLASFNSGLPQGDPRGQRAAIARFEDKIDSLCKDRYLDEALDVLFSMDQKCSVPSVAMYKSLLKSCTKRRALAQAKNLHAHLITHGGLESMKFLGEDVVSTLIKCGGLEDALRIFQTLPCRTNFSWTAVISGYTAAGNYMGAIETYHCMRGEGLEPNKYTFVSLLKACGCLSDLEAGKGIHADVLKYRCEFDLFVGTCLVDMYAKCGSISDAKNVFDGLPQSDVVLWNVMLAAYSLQGQAEQTVQLYAELLQTGVSPNNRTFVAVLQAVGILSEERQDIDGHPTKLVCLDKAKVIQSEAWSRGYESDVFICNTLISLYGKCGSIGDVQNVFDSLPQRDVVSWTSVVAAFALQGQASEALHQYERMLEEGVSPNDRTFVSVLQACGVLAEREERISEEGLMGTKSSEKVKAIHAEAWKRGYYSDVFVGSTLISMYGKCGNTVDALIVFGALAQRTVVSWNAILTMYVQQGQGEEVFELYEQMMEEGLSPDDCTLVNVLQGCGMLLENKEGTDGVITIPQTKWEVIQKGKVIHADIWRKGYGRDVFVGNTLTSVYAKCGSTEDARIVFAGLSRRDIVSWTIMLSAYLQQGQPEEALLLYNDMQGEGLSPDDQTFVAVLQACSMLAEKEGGVMIQGQAVKLESVQRGKAVHAEAWRRSFASDSFVVSSLVSLYSRCGSLPDAHIVFDGLCWQDVVSWNAMLTAYVQLGEAETALHLYGQILMEGQTSPDVRTFVSMLQGCGMLAEKEEDTVLIDGRSIKAACLQKGKIIHAETVLKGYEVESFLGNTLVSLYGKCGSIADAQTTFDGGLCWRDVVSWNAMLAAYAHLGQGENVLQLYRQMRQENDVTANHITLLCMLQACRSTGSLDICNEIEKSLVAAAAAGSDGIVSLPVTSTLIHAYGHCASMVEAQNLFDRLAQPDVVSWTALIAGYTRQGDYRASLESYEQMQAAGVQPDGVTFLSLISACTHAGLVDRGVDYFQSMSRDHGITPQMEHYVGMVDLLGRAGCFTRMADLLSAMPVQPSVSLWLCLLGACQKHGQVELGRYAFDIAVRLQSKDGAAYVLMANIYAQAGLLECAKEVNDARQAAGAWKKPGQSWIGYEDEVHTFVVEDRRHPQQERLYRFVKTIGSELMVERA